MKYYFAAGQRIAMRKGGTPYYLTQDHLGGTALVTDANGAMVSRIRYFPYGGVRTIEGTDPPPTDKLFTGQQRETANGIYHYNARLYNADIGRMPQADSIVPNNVDPQAYNRYSYVENNPTNRVDPSGHATNLVCYYRSCNFGRGTLFSFSYCGQTVYGWKFSTALSDPTGIAWRINLSIGARMSYCRWVYWDYVSCSRSSIGFSVTIDWCGYWNNGAPSPYYFTDAGFNATVCFVSKYFPMCKGRWLRFGVDIYSNWGMYGG